ncbi:MAG: 50S ribosomal protein L33 [Rhodopseudomonas palustris]|nr:50S ribosomal protein L33 [Rhodopseudomonas palustris]
MRDIITLAVCRVQETETTRRTKNKKNTPDKLELKKYCRCCRKHTAHKETKANAVQYTGS